MEECKEEPLAAILYIDHYGLPMSAPAHIERFIEAAFKKGGALADQIVAQNMTIMGYGSRPMKTN
ncbi:MAG: hypothetical protein IJC16_00010 [Rikenellaceae bacterium]|nr:hypothetical protein [Rikenellaceae bacterium]